MRRTPQLSQRSRRASFVRLLLVVGVTMLLGVACTPDARSPHDLALSSAGLGRTVRIEPGHAHGPDTDVERFNDELRGVWYGVRVNARLTSDRVIGLVDSRPLDMHVQVQEQDREPSSNTTAIGARGNLGAHGLIGTRLGDISLTDEALRASIDGCGYELQRAEDALTYRGYRCGSIPTRMTLPENWSSIPATERATYLALMLMR